jgi:hypothetical protein
MLRLVHPRRGVGEKENRSCALNDVADVLLQFRQMFFCEGRIFVKLTIWTPIETVSRDADKYVFEMV